MKNRNERGQFVRGHSLGVRFGSGQIMYHPPKGIHLSPKTEFRVGRLNSKKGKHQWFICNNCHKKFYPSDQVKRKYCFLCKFMAFKGENNPAWKGGKPRCQVCKKLLSNYKAQYCVQHNGIYRRGEKCHLWKGGVTSQNRLNRIRFRNIIQPMVLSRDNYTCQICHKRGGFLQVDHIQPWADYVKLRFNIDNCRTVCMSCHYKITFGRVMPKEIKSWGHNLKYYYKSDGGD